MSKHKGRAVAIVDACRVIQADRNALVRAVERSLQALEDELLGVSPAAEMKGALPVVVYFQDAADREAFILAVKQSLPNLTTRTLPPAT